MASGMDCEQENSENSQVSESSTVDYRGSQVVGEAETGGLTHAADPGDVSEAVVAIAAIAADESDEAVAAASASADSAAVAPAQLPIFTMGR